MNLPASSLAAGEGSRFSPLQLLYQLSQLSTPLVLLMGLGLGAVAFLINLGSEHHLHALYLLAVVPIALKTQHMLWPWLAFFLVLLLRLQALLASGDALHLRGDALLAVAEASVVLYLCRGIRARYLLNLNNIAVEPTTGMLSSAAFQLKLEDEVAWQRRYKGVLTLVVVEVEPADDPTLSALARELSRRLRRTDAIGHLEQGRFAVLLRNAASDQASPLPNTLHQHLRPILNKCHSNAQLHTGTSLCRQAPNNATDFLADALQSLKQAQRTGQGAVVRTLQPG